jgi:hypothetical protein
MTIMKKVIILLMVMAVAVIGFSTNKVGINESVSAQMEDIRENSRGSKYLVKSPSKAVETTKEIEKSTPYNDEYDFYTYEITKVFEDEIDGVGLDRDGGIVLSKYYDNVDLSEGDIITVVFEAEEEGKIVDIQKLVMKEDGSYIPEKLYK